MSSIEDKKINNLIATPTHIVGMKCMGVVWAPYSVHGTELVAPCCTAWGGYNKRLAVYSDC